MIFQGFLIFFFPSYFITTLISLISYESIFELANNQLFSVTKSNLLTAVELPIKIKSGDYLKIKYNGFGAVCFSMLHMMHSVYWFFIMYISSETFDNFLAMHIHICVLFIYVYMRMYSVISIIQI